MTFEHEQHIHMINTRQISSKSDGSFKSYSMETFNQSDRSMLIKYARNITTFEVERRIHVINNLSNFNQNLINLQKVIARTPSTNQISVY